MSNTIALRSPKLTILIGLILCSFFLNAQQATMDSLKLALTSAKDDTSRCNILNKMIELESDDLIWPAYNLELKAICEKHLTQNNSDLPFYKKNYASTLNNVGFDFQNKGDITKALEFYLKGVKIQEEVGDKIGLASSLNNIGLVYNSQGNIPKTLEYFNKSILMREEVGDRSGIANSLNNIGIIHKNQGDIQLALDHFLRALKIREEIGDQEGIGYSLASIASIYFNQDNIPKAVEYYKKSLLTMEKIGNKKGVALALNNMGTIYKTQGDLPAALECYNKSLKLREETRDKSGIATCYNNIATTYFDPENISLDQDTAKAMEYIQKSLKIWEEIGEKSGIAYGLNNIGVIYKSIGEKWNDSSKLNLSLDYSRKSLKIREEMGDKKGIALCLYNTGVVYLNKKNYQKGIDNGIPSYKLAKEIGYPDQTKAASHLLLKCYMNLNATDSAFYFLSNINSINNKSISNNYFILSEREKELYFATLEKDYMLYYEFSEKYNKTFPMLLDTAYNISLANKGLTLKSSTAIRNAILTSGDTTLVREYEEWRELKKKISKLYESGKETKTIEDKANELEKELVKKSLVFSDFEKVKNLDWKQVQKGLKKNEAAIEFIHFKNNISAINSITYAALIIKPNSVHPEMIKLCEESDLEKILGTFQGNNITFVNKVYGTKKDAQNALYEKIWKPMENTLKGTKTIYYSPSGLLHKISFAAINNSKTGFLCDNYNLHHISSTGTVAMTKAQYSPANNDEYMLIGGADYNSDSTVNEVWKYLAGTLSEIHAINKLLEEKKAKVQFYSSKNASEEGFKQHITQVQYVHIATHGFFFSDSEKTTETQKTTTDTLENKLVFRGGTNYANWSFVHNKNPLMRSGLVFSGANDVWDREPSAEGEDGILTAQEVANLDMRKVKLAVLSACETGLGDIKGSEGVYGLQRAFKMAGVNKILMSLWQVPDKETAEFMTLFYSKINKADDIKKAFNETQREMRKKYDPYYWAAFVLIE